MSELEKYKTSKGAIQFPIDKQLPLTLIKKIVKFRVEEDIKAVSTKPLKKSSTKTQNINKDILSYNNKQSKSDKVVCNLLSQEISNGLTKTENKIWHGHPVWFLDGNPIVGYSKQKAGIRLMFWSGASFDETGLEVRGKKFKDASVFYNAVSEINTKDLKRWLKKSKEIQFKEYLKLAIKYNLDFSQIKNQAIYFTKGMENAAETRERIAEIKNLKELKGLMCSEPRQV